MACTCQLLSPTTHRGEQLRHFAAQNINQLRNLINVRAAQHATKARNTAVLPCRMINRLTFVTSGRRSKLKHFDCFVVNSAALVATKDRATRVEFDHQADEENQR